MVILWLFLLVDCKMENEKLSLQVSLLRDDYEKLEIETQKMRKHYARAFYQLVEQDKPVLDDLTPILPEREIQSIKPFRWLYLNPSLTMRKESPVKILTITEESRDWVRHRLRESWSSTNLVSRGKTHKGDQLPGFIGYLEGEPVGLCTYRIDKNECELVSINSYREGVGVGTGLIDRVIQNARKNSCSRVWLITSNDNLHALKFYQKYGFRLVTIYPGALDISRKLKPEIPLVGLYGIPLRDEIELEFRL